MNNNNLFILFLCCFFSLTIYSQNNATVKAEEKYTNYFKLPRETLFVHTNKTVYLEGEEIWFKGYAYDQKNLLSSKATTNFNIGIYDANGKEIKRRLFQGTNGTTKGNFLIDSTFTSGTYYIKASTNWMKNFNDDGAYIQKIKIYANKIAEGNITTTKNAYDFQFLPEGGHIVANTSNTIGFKITNATGKGIAASGTIYNEKNEEVTKFKSNNLGIGKFLFQPKANQKYTSKITLDSGETIEQALPMIKNQGISIIMNNLFPDRTIITLNTNTETLEKVGNTPYKLLIHRSGKLKTINFSFDQGTSKTITIPKKELFKGINIVTLFDENEQPILERLFFNASEIKDASINVENLNTVNDSITVSIKELNLNEDANISISVLPEETESYNPDNTIISSFLLKPYVKGTIENPAYYFTKLGRKQQYELDMLLLTQGWSKYNWNEIFNNPPKQNHRFENGITIKGKVNSPSSGVDRLFLYSTKNHSAQFVNLSKDQSFTISNFFIEEGEQVRFSYQNKSGSFKKPSLFVSYTITNKEDSINSVINTLSSYKTKSDRPNLTISEDFFSDDLVDLEEITLETKKNKKNRENIDPVLVNAATLDVDVQTYAQYPLVTDYIINNGYRFYKDSSGVFHLTNRSNLSFQKTVPPLVYLDDVPVTNIFMLEFMRMADVEKIIIDRTGLGYGLRAAGGVIKIYRRTTALYKDERGYAEVSNNSVAPFAFSKAKEYYSPKYNSYKDNYFKKYGVISWIPDIALTKNETASFKIFNTRTKLFTLYIEGITKEGNLISQKKVIDVSKFY